MTHDFQIPDPLPASPDPTEPSTERVSEFPSRQTPRQATLPEPTPAVPGKPITVASQVFLEVDQDLSKTLLIQKFSDNAISLPSGGNFT